MSSGNDKISMDIIEHGLGDKPDENAQIKKAEIKKNKSAEISK